MSLPVTESNRIRTITDGKGIFRYFSIPGGDWKKETGIYFSELKVPVHDLDGTVIPAHCAGHDLCRCLFGTDQLAYSGFFGSLPG
jgi:hypothetical protein